MSHAEKCPVCEGSGTLLMSNVGYTAITPLMQPCHGCGGTGWVVVEDKTLQELTREHIGLKGEQR